MSENKSSICGFCGNRVNLYTYKTVSKYWPTNVFCDIVHTYRKCVWYYDNFFHHKSLFNGVPYIHRDNTVYKFELIPLTCSSCSATNHKVAQVFDVPSYYKNNTYCQNSECYKQYDMYVNPQYKIKIPHALRPTTISTIAEASIENHIRHHT